MRTFIALMALAAAAAAQSYATRHFDEPLPLQLDAGRIALLSTEAEAAAALAARGLATAQTTPIPLGGVLVALPAGRTPEAVISDLAGEVFAAPVFVGRFGGPVIPTAEILLRFEAGVPADAQRAVLDAVGASVVAGPGWAGMDGAYKLAVAARDGLEVLELANALADRPDVRFANPDWIFTGKGDLLPTDPDFGGSWSLHNTGQDGGTLDEDMDGPEAWDIETGDADVIVVVLDVGVEQDHPDIAQVPGEDFVYEGSGGDAWNGCDHHGTAVAGCISSILDNGLGTAGAAPGCSVASARSFTTDTFFCDGSWWTFTESTPNALAWAESLGARVSNNSNYYGFTDSSIDDAYADTHAAGMVHFASAGNFAVEFVEYPASLPDVNAISATDRDGALAWFSSWGDELDLSAPGLDVMSTDRTGADGYHGGDYGLVSGTSFSSPYSAAAAALVVSRNPWLSALQVEDILFDSAVDHGAAGWDDVFGEGVVNLRAALLLTPADPWTLLGGGIAGVDGVPQLAGTGTLLAGSLGTLELEDAIPSTPGLMFVSLVSFPAPFKGGTLLASPPFLNVAIVSGGGGTLVLPFLWPAGVPGGTDLWFQIALPDGAAVKNVALSTGLRAETP